MLWVFFAVAIVVPITLLAIHLLTPRETQENFNGKFGIFRKKHNWVMTHVYVMTYGSFIGYARVFPKLIDDVFGVVYNPDLPNYRAERECILSRTDPRSVLVHSFVLWVGGSLTR